MEKVEGSSPFIRSHCGNPCRRLRSAPALPLNARRRRPTTTALSRPAPHLRLTGDQHRQHRPGTGMDEPRRHQDDDALPAPQEPRRRRQAALCGLPPQEAQTGRQALDNTQGAPSSHARLTTAALGYNTDSPSRLRQSESLSMPSNLCSTSRKASSGDVSGGNGTRTDPSSSPCRGCPEKRADRAPTVPSSTRAPGASTRLILTVGIGRVSLMDRIDPSSSAGRTRSSEDGGQQDRQRRQGTGIMLPVVL